MMRTVPLLVVVIASFVAVSVDEAHSQQPPNILWISTEDISPHLGCYDVPHATTPNLDQLATEGVRYTHAFTVTGVCATCRNSMITCKYPSTLGAQFMRCKVDLPNHIKLFPEYFREAGYYCTNRSKTDYNVTGDPKRCWDDCSKTAHWRNRPDPNQPFFAVFNFTNTHESKVFNYKRPSNLSDEQLHDPDKMQVPPYYPDNAVSRADWAHYFDNITSMDAMAGELLKELDDAGLRENTIVVFWSDHGVGLPRAKRWIYDSGTRVPLIVRIPDAYRVGDQAEPGTVSDRLISMIDLPVTMMSLAGLAIPDYADGRPFLGASAAAPRQFFISIRDRMDERYDTIRAVRDSRYKYIRNYQPFKPYFQVLNYMEQEHTMKELRRLHRTGTLHPEAAQFMADRKPLEELYDLRQDPHEVKNLITDAATNPELQQVLTRLRSRLEQWIFETRDTGLIPEAELARRARPLGTRYDILRQPGGDDLLRRLLKTNRSACGGQSELPNLLAASQDEDAAVRFWGMTGIANLASTRPIAKNSLATQAIRRCLSDPSGSVRVAAARAAWKTGDTQRALPVLAEAAKSNEEFLALEAMNVIDEMNEDAKPLADVVQWVLHNTDGYQRRVALYLTNES